MDIFRIKLRKRWRRWRRAIWTFGACGLVAFMAWFGLSLSEKMKQLMTEEPAIMETLGRLYEMDEFTLGDNRFEDEASDAWLEELKKSNKVRIVHLNKIYNCGIEESSVLGIMTPSEISDLLKEHPDRRGQLGAGGDIWLEEYVEDATEACLQNEYIGIDNSGNLSLFEGKPQEKKVIKTFFQLDVETMESVLPEEVLKQLNQGIRVQDTSEYNSVLSTFSDFAVEQNK